MFAYSTDTEMRMGSTEIDVTNDPSNITGSAPLDALDCSSAATELNPGGGTCTSIVRDVTVLPHTDTAPSTVQAPPAFAHAVATAPPTLAWYCDTRDGVVRNPQSRFDASSTAVSVAGVTVAVVVPVVVGVVHSQLLNEPSMNRETALLRSRTSLSHVASLRSSPKSPHVNVPL